MSQIQGDELVQTPNDFRLGCGMDQSSVLDQAMPLINQANITAHQLHEIGNISQLFSLIIFH